MVPLKRSLLVVVFLLAWILPAEAQIRCGTVEYDSILKAANPRHEKKETFEQWMQAKISQLKNRQKNGDRTESTPYSIPIVVHVIHNGEAVGTGTNISDAQVMSQISVLNQDYQRSNPDAVNTPAEFTPVAGSINLTFVLAKQDPEGYATNGIVRVKGGKSSYAESENSTFKALSYWPAEDYLNIWVLRIIDPNQVIGYAQLPVSSLPGLEETSSDRLTDGVAINYLDFGSDDFGGFTLDTHYNKGRTATHEIGHILGLRHIWGDGTNCTATDYCDDTPSQDAKTVNCPTNPALACGHDKMFQNYMDYTYDPCMNIFTADQVARMVTVLGNSPRRLSLLTSHGLSDPVAVANDLGLRNIVSPVANECPGTKTPTFQIRNYGSNNITTARIQLSVNSVVVETKDFALNLVPNDTINITFSAIALVSSSSTYLQANILLTNGTTDGKSINDVLARTAVTPSKSSLPLFEPFNSLPSTWSVENPDGLTTWQNVTAPQVDANNTAMYMDFYNYQDIGAIDKLISPTFDLLTDTAASLKFDRSYASFSTSDNDRLQVLVFSGCDFTNPVEIFNKAGSSLTTATNSTSTFTPKNSSDWKTETISLKQFLGKTNVQVAFVATDDYGNNLYVDNVRILNGNYSNLTLAEVKSPSPVTCESNPTPIVVVINSGSDAVNKLIFSTTVNSTLVLTDTYSGFTLNTGEQKEFSLQAWPLATGTNAVVVSVQEPGFVDVNPSDNSLTVSEIVNNARNGIPLRENFDGNYDNWTIVSESQTQSKWTPAATNKKLSLAYDAFSNAAVGSKSWLVSPVLDFSKAQKSSLFFDLSYAKSSAGSERLQVLGSIDCGQTFTITEYDQSGERLSRDTTTNSSNTSNLSWAPVKSTDWNRQYVNLDKLVGNANARVALIATNGDGNNLYIDNIEIFIDDNKNPVSVDPLYSVYNNYKPDFKITFNLPESEDVHLQVYNSIGQVVVDNRLANVLNQTYDVDLTGQGAGVYIVRMQIGNELSTAKVMVSY
jgi:Pregnancy-associated plasma protein-A